MYKIIETTDGNFIGRLIDFNQQIIVLDDYEFKIKSVKYDDDIVVLSNDNYIIKIKQESEV